MTLAERGAETPTVVRMLVDTCSSQHRAPDGGIKFPQGLVVAVDEGGLDAVTVRRWIRNRLCEPFDGGLPGEVVTPEERVAEVEDLDAEIARLERLRARAVVIASGRAEALQERAGVPQVVAVDTPIGGAPYRAEEDPLKIYELADQQVEALRGAGFTRPEIIDAATDEELMEIPFVKERTVARLRAHRQSGG